MKPSRSPRPRVRAVLGCALLLPLQVGGGEPIDYARDVQPVFDRSCDGAFCHIGISASGVELTNYERLAASIGDAYGTPVVVPFRPLESPLLDKVANDVPQFGLRMPFGDKPLTETDIEVIRRWISEGAVPTVVRPRGDLDGDQRLSILDPILLLNALFLGGAPPPSAPEADADSDGTVDLGDVIFLLEHLFRGGPRPAPVTL